MTREHASALIGQLVDDRYRVLQLIGRGGMGAVYEAEAVRLGRKCAFKVLLPEYTKNATAVQRFRREAHVAARVKHPNVVEVFDTGTTADGHGYIAMELLQGESLERTLRHERRLPWPRVRHFALQICRALAAAHAQRVIHRDMKPENCFRLTQDGDRDYIKVLDFGIAKLSEGEGEDAARLTATNSVIGTYAYMAYEQIAGMDCDHRVDIWAVGVIMYELLTGSLPFPGQNQGQIWAAIFQQAPVPMRVAAPGSAIPPAVEGVIFRALAKTPAARYPTIEAFASAIAGVDEKGTSTVEALAVTESTVASLSSPIDAQAPTAAAGRPLALDRTVAASPGPGAQRLAKPDRRAATDIGERDTLTPGTDPLARTEFALSESVATEVHRRPGANGVVVAVSRASRRRRATALLAGGGLFVWLVSMLLPSSPPEVTRSAVERVSEIMNEATQLQLLVPVDSGSAQRSPTEADPGTEEPEVAEERTENERRSPVTTTDAGGAVKATTKTTKKKTPVRTEDYRTRIVREVSRLCKSSAFRACFSTEKAGSSISVKFEIEATTGSIKATLPLYLRGSTVAACMERETKRWKPSKGGPGDENVTYSCTVSL